MMRDMAWLSEERPRRRSKEWCCLSSAIVEHDSMTRRMGK